MKKIVIAALATVAAFGAAGSANAAVWTAYGWMANVCVTPQGSVPMVQLVPVGAQCFAATPWGPVAGIAQ